MAGEATNDSQLFVTVEGFAATDDRPDGICGIIALNPDRGDWRLIIGWDGLNGSRLILGNRALAFTDAGRDPRLWVLEHPWNSPPRKVTQFENQASFAWSAGSNQFIVAFYQSGKNVEKVWLIPLDGGKWTPLSLSGVESIHDCSPDGQWLLVGNNPIKIVRPDGADSLDVTRQGESCIRARFSPDGERIVYASTSHDGESLWITDIAGRARNLILPESPVTIVARWSPDGSRLALKLCDTVRGDKGWMTVPVEAKIRQRFEVIDADGGNRRPLDFPVGRFLIGDWG